MLNLNVVQKNVLFFYVHICFLPLLLVNYTCSLLFLKREHERFPLFVPSCYCIPTRTFIRLNVTTVYTNVPEYSMSVFDLFKTRKAQERSCCTRWTVWKACKITFMVWSRYVHVCPSRTKESLNHFHHLFS